MSRGGVAGNVVPDRCTVVVNRRYAPALTLEEAETEVRALLVGADEVALTSVSPATPPNLGHPLVAEFAGLLDLPVRCKLGWTDVARFSAHGVPAVNFGPGDPEVSHTAGEHVTRASVEGCLRPWRPFCAESRRLGSAFGARSPVSGEAVPLRSRASSASSAG